MNNISELKSLLSKNDLAKVFYAFFALSLYTSTSYAVPLQLEVRKTLLSELAIQVASQINKPIYVAPSADVEVTAINKDLSPDDSLWYLQKMVEQSGLTWEVDRDAIWINVVGFTPAEILEEKQGIGFGDEQLKTVVYPLNPLSVDKAQSAVKELISVLEAQRQYKEGYKPKTAVAVTPDNQGLIVTAFPTHHTAITPLVDSLDVKQTQIKVEAVIYESLIGNTESLGVNLAFQKGNGSIKIGTGSIGLSGTDGLLIDYGTSSFSALISALISEAETTVLSTPSLMLMNGESAYLTVGDNIPVLTGSEQTESGTPFQTVKRMDVGVSMNVTAEIMRNGLVKLNIDQQASSISESEATTVDVVTSKRQVQTVLLARPGQELSFGGLIREETLDSKTGLPLVSYLPVVGNFFEHNEETSRRSVFNVVLKVEIIEV